MSPKKIRGKLKIVFRQWIDLVRTMLPKSREEVILFSVLMLAYGALGLYILYTTSAIDAKVWSVDAYFGFDNSAVYLRGYTNIPRHPLLTIFTKPMMLMGDLLQAFVSYKAKGVLFILVCDVCVSLSALYVFRYIKEVVELDRIKSYILTIFVALTPTFMVLSFTADTFTFSLWILSFIVLYYSWYMKQNKSVPLVSQSILTIITGGITITNTAKAFIPVFFTKGKFSKHIKESFIVGILLLVILLVIDYKHGVFIHILIEVSSSNPPLMLAGKMMNYAIDGFFGFPILMSEMTTLHQHLELPLTTDIHTDKYIVPSFYTHCRYYCVLILFYGAIVYSVVKNWKNKYVIMLVLVWACDIIIHLVAKFGINELFIYAGHWVYLFPMILAWGLKDLGEKMSKIAVLSLTILFLFMLISNINQFISFVQLIQDKYPPI